MILIQELLLVVTLPIIHIVISITRVPLERDKKKIKNSVVNFKSNNKIMSKE